MGKIKRENGVSKPFPRSEYFKNPPGCQVDSRTDKCNLMCSAFMAIQLSKATGKPTVEADEIRSWGRSLSTRSLSGLLQSRKK